MNERYDTIGVDYNETRMADPYLFGRLMELFNPSLDKTYLEIGCGTGNYTKEFDTLGFTFMGIDPSQEMLSKARATASKVDWRFGKAEDIPLPEASMDGVMAFLTIHHWQDVNKGFSEIRRVLKDNGDFVLFTCTPQQMEAYWLNHYFPQMLKDSMAIMPPFEQIERHLNANGMELVATEKYFVKNDLQDLFLQAGKYNPALYFEPSIRKGISSFAAFSNAEEVAGGLTKLKRDMDTGSIDHIIKTYESDLGDYLFIKAKKIA